MWYNENSGHPQASTSHKRRTKKELKMKLPKILFSLLVLSILLLGAAGCSGKNAECKVSLDKDGVLNFNINPPGESGEGKLDGSLQRNMSISPGNVVTTYQGELVKTFDESGNSYTIQVDIEVADDRITTYKLEVSGPAYGDTPHTCSK
jgi:hypothetical protein